jgi:hypothetical protein
MRHKDVSALAAQIVELNRLMAAREQAHKDETTRLRSNSASTIEEIDKIRNEAVEELSLCEYKIAGMKKEHEQEITRLKQASSSKDVEIAALKKRIDELTPERPALKDITFNAPIWGGFGETKEGGK